MRGMNPWLAVFHPSLVAKRWIRKQSDWSLQTKLDLDWFPYPYYAYCLNQASIQAKRLGIERISAIEFGVAGGNGLVAMETIAAELVKEHGVAIDVYGFDTGEGLPPSTDPRDLPYAWRRGFYKMDRPALEARLRRAALVIGDVRETVPTFLARDVAPIGFVSFDLDYYTSTMDAFRLLDAASATRLPRMFAYFDDIIGKDDELHCEHVGELLAIDDFNRSHNTMKLGRINGLSHKRIFHSAWCEQIYVLHDLTHPRYGDYTGPEDGRQAPLREGTQKEE